MAGLKHDVGKQRWDLLPWDAISRIVEVVTYGASKYAANNWQGVESDRYFAALMRHLVAWRLGEPCDRESGLSHLAHAGCNIVFLLWKESHAHSEQRVVEDRSER